MFTSKEVLLTSYSITTEIGNLVTRYREWLSNAQIGGISLMKIDKSASTICSNERRLLSDIDILLGKINGRDEIQKTFIRSLEWCLMEHAQMCAEWIDRYRRKTFKMPYKKWLPAVLGIYVRVNRITALLRISRGDISPGYIFSNMKFALAVANESDVASVAILPPYGDGKETVIGGLVWMTILYSIQLSDISFNDSIELSHWIGENLEKVEVLSDPPETLNATWIIELDNTSAPKRITYRVSQSDDKWFIDASSLKSSIVGLSQPLRPHIEMNLFMSSMNYIPVNINVDIMPFILDETHNWLSQPNICLPPPIIRATIVKMSEDNLLVDAGDLLHLKTGNIILLRQKGKSYIQIGLCNRVVIEGDAVDNSSKVMIEVGIIGIKPQPVQIRSEWAEIYGSNRDGWSNAVVFYSVNIPNKLCIITPHLNTIAGENIECSSSDGASSWNGLVFGELIDIYGQTQIVEVFKK